MGRRHPVVNLDARCGCLIGCHWGCLIGCHYGGGGGEFSKVKRLVRKCLGTQKRLFSGFPLACVGVRNLESVSETSKVFPMAYYNKTPMAYVRRSSTAYGPLESVLCNKFGGASYFGRVATVLVNQNSTIIAFCNPAMRKARFRIA